MKREHRRAGLLLAPLAALTLAVAGCATSGHDHGQHQASAERQAEVAAKGRTVMPFDLDRTTHRFSKTATGGVQTVTADDPSDVRQITLIRQHLAEEVTAFREGDFGDPAAIHGGHMPGLHELQEGHTRVDIRYAQMPAGAQITYITGEPSLVKALHAWFDAQVSDHGRHAEHG
ncbi:aspartate carbamoyltransferase [Microbispora sp. H10830]|uniref:aspartate carbamoyltransferase n=1 Tax=Microbispora sp. H10830 TaxID=2729109 RepID=UPI00160126F3|nr:aspartate carbamoyltransferase [Microbispora sp. H10830]